MFGKGDLNSIEKAVEAEVHVNNYEGNFRHNHYARRAFMLAFLNLSYPEQDMVRETVDDLLLFRKEIKLIPPLDRKSDMEHAKYPHNSYLRRDWSEAKLKKLRIKALHFLAGFGIIEFNIVKPWFKPERLKVSKFNYDRNHALFDLLQSHLSILDEKVEARVKRREATGNKLIYDPEKEIGYIKDSHGKKIKDVRFRSESNPLKFFNFMHKRLKEKVTYDEIREELGLRPKQKVTVTQWVNQKGLLGFFKIDHANETVVLNDFEEVEVTQ